jgi:hypothetical protein
MENNIDIRSLLSSAQHEIQRNSLTVFNWEEMKYTVKLASLMGLTESQVVIFVWIYYKSEQGILLPESDWVKLFSKFLDESNRIVRGKLRDLKLMGLLQMVNIKYMTCYSISDDVQNRIDNNDMSFFEVMNPKGLQSALSVFHKQAFNHDEMTEAEASQLINRIFAYNMDLELVKFSFEHFIYHENESVLLLLSICAKAIIDNEPFNFGYYVQNFRFNKNGIDRLRKQIHQSEWLPIELGWVELDGGNHMEFNPLLKLTSKGIDHLLQEIDPFELDFIRKKLGMIKLPVLHPQEIKTTELFFEGAFEEEVKKLYKLLEPERFSEFQQLFEENERMKGLTILFHGVPGSGKTELALQLAKQTGRPVLKLQISDILSKWVGDSESNLKRVFADYRRLTLRSDVLPILLLNECDQLIGKRMNIENSLDQMFNGLQNLLLEEMESFNGILIGTTNLTQNMDDAFERRWALKLRFETPNVNALSKIWTDLIPGLSLEVAKKLVLDFQLSPAEIYNVVRRYKIDQFLGVNTEMGENLRSLCSSEKYNEVKVKSVIGF